MQLKMVLLVDVIYVNQDQQQDVDELVILIMIQLVDQLLLSICVYQVFPIEDYEHLLNFNLISSNYFNKNYYLPNVVETLIRPDGNKVATYLPSDDIPILASL